LTSGTSTLPLFGKQKLDGRTFFTTDPQGVLISP